MPGGLSRWFGRVRVLHDGRLEASPEAGTFFDSLAQFYRKAYSTWGATAGLVAGTIMFLAVLPLLPRIGDRWPFGAVVLALVLVVAPAEGHVARAPHPRHLRGPRRAARGHREHPRVARLLPGELEKEKLPREGRPLPCRSWCWRCWWPPSPEAPSAGQAVSGLG